MVKEVSIQKNNSIQSSDKVVNVLNPDYVFFPILKGFKLKVLNDVLVKKEEVLLENEEGKTINTSISGRVVGARKCLLSTGVEIDCVAIENDYKENEKNNRVSKRKIYFNSVEEMVEKLKNYGFKDQENCKYDIVTPFIQQKDPEILIVNGIEDEPYMESKKFLMQKYRHEILETIDALIKILKVKECFFAIKSNDIDNLVTYENYVGTYPNITLRIVPDIYPIENEVLLNQYLTSKSNIIHLDVYSVLSIYYALKKGCQMTEKFITITGNAVLNPQVFRVKIGTNVKKIIAQYIKLKEDVSYQYFVNGVMMGLSFPIDNLIVTSDLNGVVINEYTSEEESECINCGKCKLLCPLNLNPKFVLDHEKEKRRIKKEQEKCIGCGLCSYVCPARIHLVDKMRGDNYE